MSRGALLVPPWRLWLPIRERYRKLGDWLRVLTSELAEQMQVRRGLQLAL